MTITTLVWRWEDEKELHREQIKVSNNLKHVEVGAALEIQEFNSNSKRKKVYVGVEGPQEQSPRQEKGWDAQDLAVCNQGQDSPPDTSDKAPPRRLRP